MGRRNNRISNFITILEIVVDALLINMGFVLGFLIRFRLELHSSFQTYTSIAPIVTVTAIVLFYFYGLFSKLRKSLYETLLSVSISLALLSIFTMAYTFFNRGFNFPRSVFFIAFAVQFVLIILWKMLVWKLQKKFHGIKPVIIFGPKKEAEQLAKKTVLVSGDLYTVRYICNTFNDKARNLIDDVDVVLVCSNFANEDKSRVVAYCLGKNKSLYIVPELFEIALLNSRIVQFDDIPSFKIEGLGLSLEQRALKRMMDIALSLMGLIVFSPVMFVVALLIKFTSPGPVLYAQERLTEGNRSFRLYKFRTMMPDAEKYTGPVLAEDDDPRITRVGKFLRKTRLDELPQLFNVLRGDMSIVGPRPERPFFVEQFKREIPDYHYRSAVKAGITGLAQILGKYSTSPEDKLRFDLLYIRNYSLLLDIKIILRTIQVIFMKEKSRGLSEDKSLQKLLESMDFNVYNEMGVTVIDKR